MSEPLEPNLTFDADDATLMRQVLDYYHATLKQSPEALDYLRSRGIDHPEAIDRFKLGYANRTLGLSLPSKQLKAGADIRGRLAQLGLYRDTGHEHFNGSLVIPVMDEAGRVVQVYGRKLLNNLRVGTPLHLYLPGPLKGVWNVEALKDSPDVILCKSLIDALTFWCAGFRNVTAAYGVEGFTADHLDAFQRHGIRKVLIAFDPDEAGDHAALQLTRHLEDREIECFRVQFPNGMDANRTALKAPNASQALGRLITSAAWMGVGNHPLSAFESTLLHYATPQDPASPPVHPEPAPFKAALRHGVRLIKAGAGTLQEPPEPFKRTEGGREDSHGSEVQRITKPSEPADRSSAPIARPDTPASVSFTPAPAARQGALPAPSMPGSDLAHTIEGQDLMLPLGLRRYRVRGWQKPLNPETLKVNLMVSKGERFHVDTLDLYQAKARVAFIRQASQELCDSPDLLKGDLGKVLRVVEGIQADQLADALKAKDPRPTLTPEERAEALALLKSPDLMGRILQDFESLGIVGEESNKLTGYLAAVSRLLDRPLALLIQSASAAGKSSLMDAVLDFMPEEDLVRYSAMSGQSLFYMGDRCLAHKVLAISEEEGAKQASYALKLLQSEGRVTMASTGKDPLTGMLTTHEYAVEGPVMLFLTTTAVDLDEELLNRCLVLTVDESREQTRAIHARQRTRETLEGFLARQNRDRLTTLHRNAQRLLEPLAVVNPFADQLRFRDHQTRSRRDHTKYLTLIRSITLLHQFQRTVRTLTHQGQELRYLEVTPADIALANRLAQEVLSRTVDELLPQTRKLLTLMQAWVEGECQRRQIAQTEFRFTRRQLREALGWGDTQLKVHLARLVELEVLLTHRGNPAQTLTYELLYEGEDADGRAMLLGLIDCSQLQTTPRTSLGRGLEAAGRGVVGGQSEGGRGTADASESNQDGHSSPIASPEDGNRTQGVTGDSVLSYLEGEEP